jgi:hypothetical protein
VNFPTLLWFTLVLYCLIRFVRYRRQARIERACRLLQACAQRFETIMEQERE